MELINFNLDVATEAFYKNLFAQLPGIATSFRDLNSQKLMFQTALKYILSEHKNDPRLREFINLLGKKHKFLGLQRFHMRVGREAFEIALRTGDPTMDETTLKECIDSFAKLEREMDFDSLPP